MTRETLLQKQFMLSQFLVSFIKIMTMYDLKFINMTNHIKIFN